MKSATTNSFRVGDQLELEIEKLTFKGSGLGRAEGKVIFVPYSAPQDKLLVEITEAKKNFFAAKIIKLISPSPQRQTPPCSLFYKCGGCNWQHLKYEFQIQNKEKIFEEIIQRNAKITLSQDNILQDKDDQNKNTDYLIIKPFIKNSKPLHYRNRIQVKSLKKNVGFFAKNSHQIINMDECLLAHKEINDFYKEWRKKHIPDEQLTKYQFKLIPKINSEGPVILEKLPSDNFGKDKKDQIKNNEPIEDQTLGFSQVNNEQNKNLIDLVLKQYSKFSQLPIIDLYGGPANFSGPLAIKHPNSKAICVEYNLNAYKEGLSLIKNKTINNLKMIKSDVETYLQRQSSLANNFVIVDPPREGLSQVALNLLIKLQPQVIVYISCDPMTWARDAQLLQTNYSPTYIQGLDMFPQTDHFEVFSVWHKTLVN